MHKNIDKYYKIYYNEIVLFEYYHCFAGFQAEWRNTNILGGKKIMKRMAQSTKGRLLLITAMVMLVAVAVCSLVVSNVSSMLEDALNDKHDLYIGAVNYKSASELLTRQARMYATTGDSVYYDEYIKEIEVTKSRETNLEAMKAIGLEPEELEYMEKVAANSAEMCLYEDRCFAYVQAGDLTAASNEVYSSEYNALAAQVSEYTNTFNQLIQDRMQNTVSGYQTAMMFCDIGQYIAIGVTILIQIIVVMFVFRELLKPIIVTEKKMKDFVRGDIHSEFTLKIDNTEVGQTAKAIADFQAYQQDIISDINYLLGEMASGNFVIESRCPENYRGDYEEILVSIRNIITTLSATLSDIYETANQVDTGASQVASASINLSQGATEQAASIEELSATVNVIADKVKANALDAIAANTKTNDAGSELTLVNDKMSELVTAMNDIGTASNQTKDIVKIIDDIAFQTNILALNAAVEAARAGEAGKGFAVVADEVRNLASKSAEAVQNTTALIESIVQRVELGTGLVDEVADKMSIVATAAKEAAELNMRMSEASQDASDSIAQLTIGVEQIADVVQNNSATSEETAAASEQLSAQADNCKDMIAKFNLR